MANIPEFISVLRRIRDVIYPEVESIYESTATLKSQAEQIKLAAAASATESALSAGIATTRANEIKNVSAQANTLSSGSSATVSYNSTDGKFTFGLPVGAKGDKGESYTVNATGTTAGRAAYDTQATGFSFLDISLSIIYFKLSATSGDWSTGASFGRGEDGADGANGTGIASIAFNSTTSDSGLASQPGGIDTYRITLSNSNTYDISLTNGSDLNIISTGFKNYIINGGFDIDQRNNKAGFTIAAGSAAFSADRWIINNTTNQTVSITVADFPTPSGGRVGRLRIKFDNAPTSGYIQVSQRIENVAILGGKQVTLSHSFACEAMTISNDATQNFGSGGSPAVTTEFSKIDTTGAINSLTKFSSSITIPSIYGKTIGAGSYTQITYNLPVRTTNIQTITQVQLEKGSAVTPFEHRPIGLELSLCQRYLPSVTGFLSGYAATTSEIFLSIPTGIMPFKTPTGISFTLGGAVYYSNNASAITNIIFFAGSSGQNHTLKVKPTGAPLTIGHGVMVELPNILFTGCEL